MKRICIDMDDTMADTVGGHLARYNAEFGASVTREHLEGKWLADHVPAEHVESLHRHMESGDFFGRLAVLPGAARVIQRLQTQYEVFIATAAMPFPKSFDAKYRWLQEHFPFVRCENYVYCGDKSILHADYLIDDQPRFLERFTGQGVLFTAPHNVRETRYPRVNSWDEVEEYFLPGGICRSE